MATRPQQDEGASAPSNVVRLPTAQPRKVQQNFKRTRAAREELTRFPGDYIHPHVRDQAERAKLVRSLVRTPELALAQALFSAMDDQHQRQALIRLHVMALSSEAAKMALALVEPLTIGDRCALDAAFNLLDEGKRRVAMVVVCVWVDARRRAHDAPPSVSSMTRRSRRRRSMLA